MCDACGALETVVVPVKALTSAAAVPVVGVIVWNYQSKLCNLLKRLRMLIFRR